MAIISKILAALLFLAPAAHAAGSFSMVQVVQPAAPVVGYNGNYQGNPNPTIVSIAPSITCSRTGTLETPAIIHCSASGTTATCTGTNFWCSGGIETNPYEDLEYTWNFGDPTGQEIFTHPISGASVNANSKQWGPEAAYVYRNATGSPYTITLQVRGCAAGPAAGGVCSGGSYIKATATTSETVAAWSGTDYYISGSGSGTSPCTQIAPCVYGGIAANLASNTRFHIDCSTYNETSGITVTNSSHVRILADGPSCSGSCPTINLTSGTGNSATVYSVTSTGSATVDDVAISGICLETSGSWAGGWVLGLGGSSSGGFTNILIDNVAINDTIGTGGDYGMNIQAPNVSAAYSGFSIWGGSVSQPLGGNGCSGILGGPQEWYSIVGETVSGGGNGGSGPTLCHHIYIHTQQHVLARWNAGGLTCTGCTIPARNYTIKDSMDCANVTGGITGQDPDCVPTYTCPSICYGFYHLISENLLKGTRYGRNISNSNNDSTATRMHFYVSQQNEWYQLPGTSSLGSGGGTGIFQPTTSETLTVRDEWVCNPGDEWFVPNGVGSNPPVFIRAQLYRINYYQGSGPSLSNNFAGFLNYGTAGAVNWGGGGSPFTQVVTDNNLEDAGSSNLLISWIKSSDWTSSSPASTLDRNSYYVPNAGVNMYLSNNGSGVSFSSWQGLGWDTHGSATAGGNTNWPSPATCEFGTWPFN